MDVARALQVFVRIARRGSFRKAAAELGLSPQAVSRSVDALERELGVQLLTRTTRQVTLTVEGADLVDRAERALDQLDDVLRSTISGEDVVAGLVRVAAPLEIGREFVAPILFDLAKTHPQIRIDLVIQDAISDMVAEGIDVAVRGGRLPDSRLIAKRVAPIQQMVCASPTYLRNHGVPQQWELLRHHRLTGFRLPRTGKLLAWERRGADGSIGYDEFEPCLSFNETTTEAQAVLDGLGIGQLASFSAIRHLRSGKLKLLFPECITEQYGLYLVHLQRVRVPQRVRTVIDALIKGLSNHPDLYLRPEELAALLPAQMVRKAPRARRPLSAKS
jgi:DNA-binding transcriptional LysR family regulator